nr:hypothetical protein [Tanacetum cinerariifolium]
MVDFIEASPLRYALTVKPTVYVSHIRQFWSTARIETTEEGTKILATVDGIVRTVSESSLRRNLKLRDEEGISSLSDMELFENLTLMGYNISPNQKFTFQKGSGTPTESHHTPSPEAPSPSHTTHTSPLLPPVTTTSIPTVTPTETTPIRQYTRRARIAQSYALPTIADEPVSPQRDVSQREACPTDSGFIADQDRATIAKDDVPIKGRSMDEGEAATERVSDDTEEMATVLISMDAATVLAIPTRSEEVPIASPVFATATVVTPVTRRKGKEVMVESETPKKQKVQEQIDAQVARELEEQLEREDQRRAEQIARDAEVARIHVEKELQSMIDGLSSNNETIDKYLQEYHQFSLELPIERRVELIRWKVKDFRGMTFEEVEAKFNSVRKQIEDFIPLGSKKEAEKIKRKGLNLEQGSAKKQKTSEEVPEEAISPEEVTREKVKEMMQLVPIEEVYVEALQVKHPIIDWKDKEIFMLVEKDYPLRKGMALVMICYKLQVENFSHIANDLVLKIYKIANSPRQQ